MPDMIKLYAPEPPKPPHRCNAEIWVRFDPPPLSHGAVIECRECGQCWWADVEEKPSGAEHIYTLFWRKVRWYHFDLKKKVRENG